MIFLCLFFSADRISDPLRIILYVQFYVENDSGDSVATNKEVLEPKSVRATIKAT